MASKEFNVFVVDLSPSMGAMKNGRRINDLEYGLKYYNDFIAETLLKKRKQDRVAIVLCHSKSTKNPHADESSLRKIEVLYEDAMLTYEKSKEYSRKLAVNTDSVEKNEGDCLEALLVGIGIFKDSIKYKFNRRIVIITNSDTEIASFGSKIAEASSGPISQMNIEVLLNGIDIDGDYVNKSSTKMENESKWRTLIANYGGRLVDTKNLNMSLNYAPPLKKVRPVVSFSGHLRYGTSLESLTSDRDSINSDDKSQLCIKIQVFPAVKPEKLLPSHQYIIKEKSVHQLKYETFYHIKKKKERPKKTEETQEGQNDEQEKSVESDSDDYEKEYVSKGDWEPGFKYSNMDLIAIDNELSDSAKLRCNKGMDILGFIKNTKLPYVYFMQESSYVIPERATTKNIVAFRSLCVALEKFEVSALVRYVPKNDSDIQLCALMSTKVINADMELNNLILIRLAFKEDEKIGRFPSLTQLRTTADGMKPAKDEEQDEDYENEEDDLSLKSDLKKFYPSSGAKELMKAFILSKDLDNTLEPLDDGHKIRNQKVSLIESDTLRLIQDIKEDIDTKLLPSSLAIHKFIFILKKIIKESLKQEDFDKFLNDKNFITKYLLKDDDDTYEFLNGEDATNFFNLKNVLSINTSGAYNFLNDINLKSLKPAGELLEKLDIKYRKAANLTDPKKRKTDYPHGGLWNRNKKPNYGESEGEYDEALNLEKLLE
ncbi:uncharacterized protein PRCAT00005854001 [Priceomyces carsonii]|uniref:uncharacterized protein n=1 Tax=Priceomyces carsonii TaxID=28549 RepID=UPI002EDB2E8B|nr:unnamed protein product [Priceomyces carsonii]